MQTRIYIYFSIAMAEETKIDSNQEDKNNNSLNLADQKIIPVKLRYQMRQ